MNKPDRRYSPRYAMKTPIRFRMMETLSESERYMGEMTKIPVRVCFFFYECSVAIGMCATARTARAQGTLRACQFGSAVRETDGQNGNIARMAALERFGPALWCRHAKRGPGHWVAAGSC